MNPDQIIVIRSGKAIDLTLLSGRYKYIIFTGGHGDIYDSSTRYHGQPSYFNGMRVEDFERALKTCTFTSDLLILDSCFSALSLPIFIEKKVLSLNGSAIVSIGACPGWTNAFLGRGKGEAFFSIYNDFFEEMLREVAPEYNSLAIYRNKNGEGKLYQRSYSNLKESLVNSNFSSVDAIIEDIDQMEMYLKNKEIEIEKKSIKELQDLFREGLKRKKL